MRAVLTYHSIDGTGSPISVPPRTFRRHVEWLASGRVDVLALGDVLRAGEARDAVAITFDDGFDNVYHDAWPVLTDHALPFTVFVVTDHVGGRNNWGGVVAGDIPDLPLMSWDALGRLREAGAEIGAHTRHHHRLSGLAPSQLDDEMAGSAERIAHELGARPSAFAYPYGDVDASAAERAAALFDWSCTTEHRPLQGREHRALVPRLDMWYFRQGEQLEKWGSAAFRGRLWLRGQARRVRGLAGRMGFVS
jgi:peptidoglycan/xylan/chitin deacetylase (PgdA/CDA1 family)